MIRPKPLQKGDRIAVISLSSGILGEQWCAHQKELGERCLRRFGLEPVYTAHALSGTQYLAAHPEARAADLKAAFLDDSIRGIICAIGGMDTFRTLPFLMEDSEFTEAVRTHPKFFLGYSDSTCNHLMFQRLGLQTFYGQALLPDLAELSGDMLFDLGKLILGERAFLHLDDLRDVGFDFAARQFLLADGDRYLCGIDRRFFRLLGRSLRLRRCGIAFRCFVFVATDRQRCCDRRDTYEFANFH